MVLEQIPFPATHCWNGDLGFAMENTVTLIKV